MQSVNFDSIFKVGILIILLVFLYLFLGYSTTLEENGRFQFSYNSERSAILIGDSRTGEFYMGTSIDNTQLVWLKVNPRTGTQELIKSTPR